VFILGRIRPTFIKRIAREIVEKYRGELTEDFHKNRAFIVRVVDISNEKLRNKVAGYVTSLLTKKEVY